ncbi:PH domain-containing protein [Isoptericola hypogeus]|uniref:PH domain-containing protein n=1 Tax=Isoptericola hypogeus TaxID=300179 RepID=A0ABN2JGI3_9MICO
MTAPEVHRPAPSGGEARDAPAPAPAPDDAPWLRLSGRTVAVDLVQTVVSLAPTAVAVVVFGLEPTWEALWPLVVPGVLGALGALGDALRWAFTRYRVTDEYVERRSGIVVRRYRSVRRDRIRSVDTSARLRHRVAGLRVVLVGAGQQKAAGESALALDALALHDAEALRCGLLAGAPGAARVTGTADGTTGAGRQEPDDDRQVLARFRWRWVVHHVLGVWAFVSAAGLLWGGYWLATTIGLDPGAWVEARMGPERLGWPRTIVLVLLLTGALGAVSMAATYVTTYWGFELARVPGAKGSQLRTRRGLFTTREVVRDDSRLRGVQISEPVLRRWMGTADTQVVTTGLSVWSTTEPATVLPRGPVGVARTVASAVLGADPDPLAAPLARHPRGALRRRLWWATAGAGLMTAVLGLLAGNGVVDSATVWWGAALWAGALLAAVVAYRALGHTITGRYLVVRSGLVSRATTVLRRDAVSTVALRESVLQRRLGLRTVSVMTAAGWGVYEAPDVSADDALAFALRAAPGLLDPFVVPGPRR